MYRKVSYFGLTMIKYETFSILKVNLISSFHTCLTDLFTHYWWNLFHSMTVTDKMANLLDRNTGKFDDKIFGNLLDELPSREN